MEYAKFWQEFFLLYKDLPALWRVRSTEYSDRVLKSKCYLMLIRKLKEIYPNADRELVVKKINNFRTSYRKELRKLRESKQLGKVYKPSLWYFDCLRFLDDQDEIVVENSINGDEYMQEEVTQHQNVITTKIEQKNIPTKRPADFQDHEKEEILPNTSKRKKIKHFSRKKPSSKQSHEEQQQTKVDTDILAKSWAVQYKEMQGNQKLIARKLISDILFYGCLGTLNMSHALQLQGILLKETTTTTQPQSPIESNGSHRLREQEHMHYDSFRESPLEFNNCSPPLSPTKKSVCEFEISEIKYEVT